MAQTNFDQSAVRKWLVLHSHIFWWQMSGSNVHSMFTKISPFTRKTSLKHHEMGPEATDKWSYGAPIDGLNNGFISPRNKWSYFGPYWNNWMFFVRKLIARCWVIYIEHLIDEKWHVTYRPMARHHFQAPALLLPRGRPAWMMKIGWKTPKGIGALRRHWRK